MDRKKALEILNLKDNYTDDERKKAYKELSVLHHPDMCLGKSEEIRIFHETRMKEINSANDFLVKHKPLFNASFKSSFDSEDYKDILNSEINSYFVFHQKASRALFMEVVNAAKPFFVPQYQDTFVSETEMNERIAEFLQRLEVIYRQYQKEFLAKYNIPEPIEPLKYDVHVDDFYEQLLNIKNKYIPEQNSEERYNELYTLMRRMEQLHLIIKKALKRIKNPEFASLYAKINARCLSVSREETIASLEQLVYSIEEYENVHTKALKSSQREELLDALTNRYNEASELRKDDTKELDKIYQAIISIFGLYFAGKISYDILFMLENISFVDLESDFNIINKVNNLIPNENNDLGLK